MLGAFKWFAFISFGCLLTLASAEYFDECDGVDDLSYVASSQSCSAFIYCNGEESTLDECEEGEYFNGEECEDKDNVYCALDDVDNESGEEGDGDGDGEEPEESEVPDEEPEEVQVETTKATPPPTTPAPTTPPPAPVDFPLETLDVPPIVRDACPATDDPNQIVLILNSNSCSDYYVCYHGHAIAMHCMDHLHFNAATGKCDFPENAKCKVSFPERQVN